jgi:voltage-gated potassium channel
VSSTKAEKITNLLEIVVLIAAFLVIPTIIIEQSNLANSWGGVANILNWLIWTVFVIESIMLFSVAKNKKQWVVSHPLELGIILLTSPIMPPALQSGRALRLLRLIRLIRLVRITQMVNQLFSLKGLAWAAFLSLIIVIGGGVAFTIIEKGQHLSEWDGLYWAMTTVTTVGSNISPSTTTGRIITIAVLLVGTGFVAILTAAIAERFMKYAKNEEKIAVNDDKILKQLNAINLRLDKIEKKLK